MSENRRKYIHRDIFVSCNCILSCDIRTLCYVYNSHQCLQFPKKKCGKSKIRIHHFTHHLNAIVVRSSLSPMFTKRQVNEFRSSLMSHMCDINRDWCECESENPRDQRLMPNLLIFIYFEWFRRHFGVENNNEFKYNSPVRWVSLKMKLHSLSEYLFIQNGNVLARMLCLRIADEQIEHTKKCMYLCDKTVFKSNKNALNCPHSGHINHFYLEIAILWGYLW